MSDVHNAPAPSEPPPPVANEVVVDPAPVSAPSPIGSQAPPALDKRPPAEGRKDAIQKAFDKAKIGQDEQQAKRAKPGIGHNQPPEPTEKLDLRQPPPKAEPHREQGRFARAPEAAQEGFGAPGAQPGDQRGTQPGQPRRAVQPLPEGAPYRDPPGRMADHAKAEWAAAPASVRGEVHRMAKEFQGAFDHYRADHEAMENIRPYHQMAQEHGTTLDRALSNYVGMENKLRTDLVGGLDMIVSNLNLRTADGQKIGLRDVAYHILNQNPTDHRLTQAQNAQTAAHHQIGALHQEVEGLKNALHQMHSAQQFTYTRSAVDQFADAHPRFDELGDLIEAELQAGYDLTTAYRRAELLRPGQTQAAQTRSSPPAQTRDKSIHGAPDTGASDARRSGDKPSRRSAIENAIRRVGGV